MWTYLVMQQKTLGWGSPYTQPTWQSLLLLVLLLTIGALVWLVIEIRKRGTVQLDAPTAMPKSLSETPNIPGPMTNARARALRMGKYSSVLLLTMFMGGALGWLWRDHQLASNRITYTDVYVRQKISDHHFIMQPARMQPIDSDICPESNVDWREHETLRDWTFEQKRIGNCKRVISYHRQGGLNVGI